MGDAIRAATLLAPARRAEAAARPHPDASAARGAATKLRTGAAARARLGAPAAPELAQAARDFEALLVQQMLRTASQPLAGRSLLDGGPAGRTYRALFHQELARQAAEGGGFGIARMLVEQLGGEEANEP